MTGDAADFQERFALAVTQVLEHLQGDGHIVGLVADRPRALGSVVDRHLDRRIHVQAGRDVHGIRPDDDRAKWHTEFEGRPAPRLRMSVSTWPSAFET